MITWNHRQAIGTATTDSGTVGVFYAEGSCLSTDEKPTSYIGNGSILIEMDTGSLYMFDEESETWIQWGD